jgi:hypothetical protein
MRATDGEEVGPLLDEQRAYYRALAAGFWIRAWTFPAAMK